MSIFKKAKKLFRDPELFFHDYNIKKMGKSSLDLSQRLLPNTYKPHSTYTIISAVYNVEKYLDDFFTSIINQSIGFEKAIQLIMVDDGSTDNSANIIKRYQKLFPENIMLLHKENGGQASARNLGLKYTKTPWVTFTDPDDFLDKDYFKNIDIEVSKNENLAMLSANIIFYHEKDNFYKDNHPLNYKYKNKKAIKIKDLGRNIQLSAATALIKTELIKDFRFDEDLKPCFEDAKFINEYLLDNLNKDAIFIENARYFYRKRADESSTLDKGINNEYFLNVTKNGTLKVIKKNNNTFIQNICLYHHIWQIRIILNNPKAILKLNKDEIKTYKQTLNELFKHIDVTTIEKFNIAGCDFYHKIGMLNCFKKEDSNFNICYIKKICNYKNEILLNFFTRNKDWNLKIEFDNSNYEIISKKTIEHKFIDEVFIYENYVWIRYSFLANNFKLYLDDKEIMIGYGNYVYDLNKISSNNSNIWVFIDSDLRADDNAEHLYRYVMKNHPNKKICFVLSKTSKDWQRLEKEGFNLIEFKSNIYYQITKQAEFIISSHADGYFLNDFDLFSKTKFVFLQHGITKDDLSKWLNVKNLDLFITSTKAEYESIINGNYKFSDKETKLTGFARHDNLINISKDTKVENTIILMPTWRNYLVSGNANTSKRNKNNEFLNSNYFKIYKSLLINKKLEQLLKANSYQIKIFLHHAMDIYKDKFNEFKNSQIELFSLSDISLQNELVKAKLLITDYSSIAFEMALINKPVIYYQFDKDEFFANHTYTKGYFDYERDGFGAVVETESNLINELEKLFKSDFKIEKKYQERIDNTFTFKDTKNCERIYQEIMKL